MNYDITEREKHRFDRGNVLSGMGGSPGDVGEVCDVGEATEGL